MIGIGDFYDNRAAETAEAERTAKAAPPRALAVGAKSDSESKILTVLRSAPATSMGDLQGRTRLNETALGFAFRALRDRDLVRETAGLLGTTRIIAVPLAN